MIPLNGLAKSMTSEELSAYLRQQEQADPTLRDIYGFIDNQGTGSYSVTPNGLTGGEQGWGTTGLGVRPADTQANNGADGNAPQAPMTFDPGNLFRAGVTMSMNDNANEGSGGFHFNVDDSKFPLTRYGGVSRSAPVNDNNRDSLYRPDATYQDENYGEITRPQNFKPDRLNSMFLPAVMAAMTGGMGMLGAPAMATMLPGLLQSISNGSLDIGSIVGMIARQLGVDPNLISLARLGTNLAGVDTRVHFGGKP